jgi:hypothetical protein
MSGPNAPHWDVEEVVYRPRRLIVFSTVVSVCLLALSLFGWYALPPDLQAAFTLSQIVTLLIILFGLIAGMAVLASSYVRIDSTGLRIRNGFARHYVAWSDVHKFLLRPGDPWALVLIKPDDRPFQVDLDAEKRQLMGIVAGDEPTSSQAIAHLTGLHRRYQQLHHA